MKKKPMDYLFCYYHPNQNKWMVEGFTTKGQRRKFAKEIFRTYQVKGDMFKHCKDDKHEFIEKPDLLYRELGMVYLECKHCDEHDADKQLHYFM